MQGVARHDPCPISRDDPENPDAKLISPDS